MRNKNHVSLIGMVGKDAEVRQTQGGVKYARFTLATTSGGYQARDGSQVPEKTEWHNIVAWRQLADFCGQYVKRGMKVDVEGMITYRQYESNGQRVNTCEIVASDLVLMTNPNGSGQQQQQQQRQQAPYQGQGGYQGQQGAPFPPQVNGAGQVVYNQQEQYQGQPAGPTGPLPF